MTAPLASLTVEEVAAALRVCRRTVDRLRKAKKLKGYRVGDKWRFTVAEVQAFQDEGGRRARPSKSRRIGPP